MKLDYDVHTHWSMSKKHFPDKIFGKASKWLMKKPKRMLNMAKTMRFIDFMLPKFLDHNMLRRMALVVKNSTKTAEERLQENLTHVNCVITLTMDFFSMNAGKPEQPFTDQLNEAIRLKRKYGKDKVKVFMYLDPNRHDLWNAVKLYEPFIDGYKLYPPLIGKILNHFVRLNRILTDFPKPVIIHSTNTTPIYNRKFKKKEANSWANPKYAITLIEANQNIKFDLAHLGGENYHNQVMQMCIDYKNVYTDISYTFKDNEKMLDGFMNYCPKKVLFGTDSYLIKKHDFYNAPYMDLIQKNNKVFLSK